jgi:phosphorylcholine metabolism protein LicD
MRNLESMLNLLGKISSDCSLKIFLDFGTLLGYIRCNGYVSIKDDDIDLSILVDSDKVVSSLTFFSDAVQNIGYISVPVTYNGQLQIIKFFPLANDLPTIDLHLYRKINDHHTFVFANTVLPTEVFANYISRIRLKLYYYFFSKKISGQSVVSSYPVKNLLAKNLFHYKSVIVKKQFFSLFRHHISGFLIPNEYDLYLASRYGDWRSPNHKYNYWTDQLDLFDENFYKFSSNK